MQAILFDPSYTDVALTAHPGTRHITLVCQDKNSATGPSSRMRSSGFEKAKIMTMGDLTHAGDTFLINLFAANVEGKESLLTTLLDSNI